MPPYAAINLWSFHSRFSQIIRYAHPESEIWEIPPSMPTLIYIIYQNPLFGLLYLNSKKVAYGENSKPDSTTHTHKNIFTRILLQAQK